MTCLQTFLISWETYLSTCCPSWILTCCKLFLVFTTGLEKFWETFSDLRQHQQSRCELCSLEMELHILFLWVALVQSPSLSLVVAGPMSEVTELKAMASEPEPVVSGFVVVIPGISGWEIFLWWVPAWPDIAWMIPKGRDPLRLRMFLKSLWSYWTALSSTHWIHL